MRWCLLLFVSGTAGADSTRAPVGAIVSVGVGGASQHDSVYGNATSDAVLSAQLDIGYRFHDLAMAGVHVAFASGVTEREGSPMSMFNYIDDYAYRPLHLGLSGLVMVHDRLYLSPWLGVQRGWRELQCRTTTFNGMPGREPEVDCRGGDWESSHGTSLALGLSVGSDAILFDDHRMSMSGSFTHAFVDENDRFTYTSFLLSVGYRFWTQ